MEYRPEDISEDEDFMDLVLNNILNRRPKIFRQRPNHFEKWRENEFFDRFRLSKQTVWVILGCIEDQIRSPTSRNYAVPPDVKLLLTLRFYATGNMVRACSDFCGVDRSTGCRIIRLVSHHIARLRSLYINMPVGREAEVVMGEFYAKYRFPRCVGAIDCTHVRILSPGGEHAEIYRNRKGFFSLNVQTVCDASLRIRNIVARWPGSAHDSTIFAQSRLKRTMEQGGIPGVLIGDQGYAVRPYLLRRLAHPETEGERLYNEALTRARICVERSYGVWKKRFPILAKGINVHLTGVEAIIVATAILHNIATERKEATPIVDEEILRLIDDQVPNNGVNTRADNNNNRTTQQYIDYFERLL